MSPTVALRDLDDEQLAHLAQYSAPATNLYRTLAGHPTLFPAWVDFAWTLRSAAALPRALREIMILRAVQLLSSEYAWAEHVVMAHDAGVEPQLIDALATWQDSSLFDEDERLGLALVEQSVAGAVTDDLLQSLTSRFSDPEIIELAMTVGFYAMVPAVLRILRVPLPEGHR